MKWTPAELDNINQLLLSNDLENVRLALELLKPHLPKLPTPLRYTLNVLAQFHYKDEIRDAAQTILEQVLTPRQQHHFFQLHFKVFLLAYQEPFRAWRRAYKSYTTVRDHYEPIFLFNARWERWYRELIQLFYQNSASELVIEYADLLLRLHPNDFSLNNYRYNAVNFLLEQGKAHDQLEHQEKWLQRWTELYPNTECMTYALRGQLYNFHCNNPTKAEEFYRLSLQSHAKAAWDEYAALSSNNLACLFIKQKRPLAEAYQLATQATQLVKSNDKYAETCGYLEWKFANNIPRAKELFWKALELEKSNLAAICNLTQIFHNEGDMPNALPLVEQILNAPNKIDYLEYVIPTLRQIEPSVANTALRQRIASALDKLADSEKEVSEFTKSLKFV